MNWVTQGRPVLSLVRWGCSKLPNMAASSPEMEWKRSSSVFQLHAADRTADPCHLDRGSWKPLPEIRANDLEKNFVTAAALLVSLAFNMNFYANRMQITCNLYANYMQIIFIVSSLIARLFLKIRISNF